MIELTVREVSLQILSITTYDGILIGQSYPPTKDRVGRACLNFKFLQTEEIKQ